MVLTIYQGNKLDQQQKTENKVKDLVKNGFTITGIRKLRNNDVGVVTIDGSTDRCCIAIVTNERALLSGSDQPVQNLGRHRILHVRRVNKRSKTVTFAQRNMVHC